MDTSQRMPPLPPAFTEHPRVERRDAMEHRRRILEVARQLFAEQGVDAVSMHQVARVAGVGQGTLYRRYANKGELCMDLLHERHERFVEEIRTLFATQQAAPALRRLNGVLVALITLLEEQGALLESVATAKIHTMHCEEDDPGHRFLLQGAHLYQWLYEVLTRLLAEAVEQQELPPLDIPYTADAILAAVHPFSYRFQRQERGFSSERILQGLRRIYIEGLKTPHEPSKE